METHTSKHVRLMEEVRHRIARLVDAIQRIATTKRRMQSSVTEAKSQIHSNVFSQLSAIRSREAWLLDEVDKQCQVKVDTLTRQSDTLQQSLGHLRGLLQVSTSRGDNDGGEGVDSQIVQVLESTSNEDLQPVKTLGLRFKADNVAMLRAIQNYGSVDSDGMPFDAFVHPDSSSESLPRAVEEYEDASHHVLYKTVAEIHESHSDNKSIQVAMPRLHPRAEDWLCTPSEPCGQQPAGHSAFSWNIPRSIPQLSDSASSGSLHRWLLDIQNEADNDDDGFELITRSGDQSGESSNNQTSDVTVQLPATFPVFREVADSPSSSWLQDASPEERIPDVQFRLCEDRLKDEDPCSKTSRYPRGDPDQVTDSTTDWIHVASPLRHPVLRHPASDMCHPDVTSSSGSTSVDGQQTETAETVPEVALTSPSLDRPVHSPTPELLYFRHFSVITDSPASDWLQHGRALAATTSLSSWQHEMLKLKNSDWLMPGNCSKEVPALS